MDWARNTTFKTIPAHTRPLKGKKKQVKNAKKKIKERKPKSGISINVTVTCFIYPKTEAYN